MKKKYKLLLLAYIISNMNIYGEEIKLEMSDVIKKAYKHDYELRNAKIDAENSQLELNKAYKDLLPKVNYTMENTKYENAKEIDSKDVDDYHSNEIVVTQPLFQGGALVAKVGSAKNEREKKKLQYRDAQISTSLNAVDKYINVLLAIQELRVYEVSLESLQKQYEKINRKYELDMVPKTDVLPLNTRVLNLKTQVVEAKNKIEIAKADLKNFIGVSPSDDVNLQELDEKKYDSSKIDLNSDIYYVRENNREIKIKKLDKDSREKDKIIARSEFLPKVSANYRQYSGDEKTSRSDDDFNWEAGLTVDVNVFEFGKSIDEYKVKKNEVIKAENLEKKMKDDKELQLRSSYLNLIKYKGVIAEQEAAVVSARENYNMESRRFEMDLIDSISFIQIEESLVESELSLITAKYNYYLAYAEYKSLME